MRSLRVAENVFLFVWIFLTFASPILADVHKDALRATLRISDGAASGTGFLVTVGEQAGGKCLLVTAAHVFRDMKGEDCSLVFRSADGEGGFVRKEVALGIRKDGKPLWKKHAEMDIAVMAIDLPQGVDCEPFALDQVATVQFAEQGKVRVGQDICIPCFPAKLESNSAGWPILRRGSIASHPLVPLSRAKTYLVDSSSFGGESGAPVVASVDGRALVVGLISAMQRQTDKSTMPFEERTVHTPLGLGIAVQAPFIREVIGEWQEQAAE